MIKIDMRKTNIYCWQWRGGAAGLNAASGPPVGCLHCPGCFKSTKAACPITRGEAAIYAWRLINQLTGLGSTMEMGAAPACEHSLRRQPAISKQVGPAASQDLLGDVGVFWALSVVSVEPIISLRELPKKSLTGLTGFRGVCGGGR